MLFHLGHLPLAHIGAHGLTLSLTGHCLIRLEHFALLLGKGGLQRFPFLLAGHFLVLQNSLLFFGEGCQESLTVLLILHTVLLP